MNQRFKKIAGNSSWLIVGSIYQMAVNLVITMVTARYLGPSNYGLINYAASFTTLFTSFSTLGINDILVNEFVKCRDKSGTIMGSALALRLISSGLSVISIVLIVNALNPNEPLTVWVALIYSTTLIFKSFEVITYWYQYKLESKVSTILSSIAYSIAAIYKVILLITSKDVRWFAAAHVVEYGILAILLICSYYHNCEKNQELRANIKVGRQLLHVSHHYIWSGLMVALYAQMDKIMIKQMIDEQAVGYYSAAITICTMWPFVLSAIIQSAKPVLLDEYQKDIGKFEKNLTLLYSTIILISIIAALIICILSRYILLILYGDSYLPAQCSLCIACWYTAFSYLGVARSIWMVANEKQHYEKNISLCGAICNLILNWFLIPMLGINGAAIATLLTQIFTNFVVGFFIKDIRQNNILILNSFNVFRYIGCHK